MSGGGLGLGTSSQTQQTSGSGTVSPYAPAVPSVGSEIGNAQAIFNSTSGGVLNKNDTTNFSDAINNLKQLSNFGPAANQTAADYLETGGDPTGILRSEAANLNPIASEGRGSGSGLNPINTPGLQNVLNTIDADTKNSINGQFAGAGRSLSGLNEQTLARGLSQGEAVPLLNQYNANVANSQNANNLLSGVQSAATGNITSGLNIASQAPSLADLVPMTEEGLNEQERNLPYQYIAAFENLINPAAGLGQSTTSQASGSGTANNSILSQLGQGAGLLSPFANLLNAIV